MFLKQRGLTLEKAYVAILIYYGVDAKHTKDKEFRQLVGVSWF